MRSFWGAPVGVLRKSCRPSGSAAASLLPRRGASEGQDVGMGARLRGARLRGVAGAAPALVCASIAARGRDSAAEMRALALGGGGALGSRHHVHPVAAHSAAALLATGGACASTVAPSRGFAQASAEAIALGEVPVEDAKAVEAMPAVMISEERMQEFLEAEKLYLMHIGYSTITVGQILKCTQPEQLQSLIQQELPARFATRLQQIESTTDSWREIPGLLDLYQTIETSFETLRLLDGDLPSSKTFTDVVEDIRDRHGAIVAMIAQAAVEFKQKKVMDDWSVNKWVGEFMLSRIGTEMLIHHYMSLLNPVDDDRIGIIDTKCNPGRICSDVVEHVRRNYFADSKVSIRLHVDQAAGIEFSFISEYLFFIVEELLINGVKATVAAATPGKPPPGDISVTVCADPRRLCIKISDKGGGIPRDISDHVWEYMFSAVPSDLQAPSDVGDTGLAGAGLGLPLCKLYTEYLGGELQLFSMPGIGTDVYIYFNRLKLIGADSLGRRGEQRASFPG